MTCMWRSSYKSYIFIFDTSFMVVSIGVYGFYIWGSVDGDRVIFPHGAVIRVVCVFLCLYM